ncbi:hypothetical protein QQS21_005349 [Conoideocrella luteorostrata]|uniref:Uncharacterized protein n=1 Tax=Conoideocrella luteorostrata TaxID=1105319 RepID=A0AAJ0CSL7_9HYPO|nr:hypothetical protein QQS21_005349 [Conoideocrella luteorostrata]
MLIKLATVSSRGPPPRNCFPKGREYIDAEKEEEKGQQGLYDVLPMDQWIVTAIANGMHPAVAALIEMLDDPVAADYPRLLKEVPSS